jgi:dinuclear metal center YbgI/SA1388 family protein
VKRNDLERYLDDFLRVSAIGDSKLALNGLQVESGRDVSLIAFAVDACQAVIDETASRGADLLVVHHGLFWDGVQALTGRAYRKFGSLIRNDIAVYSAHLPLDVHPEVGNNAVLMRLLGFEVQGWWGEYEGATIGTWADAELSRDALGKRIAEKLGVTPKLLPGGPEKTRRIGIVTGAGGSMIAEAHAAGIDTFITGEAKHHAFFDAEELGVNVFLAGHYATETIGLRALAEHLEKRHQLKWIFIDHPTGL